MIVLVFLVKLYQVFSTGIPRHCRFEPSCSNYAIEALQRHGAIRGSILAAGRVARCHPWNAGGVDPVPTALGRR